MDNVDEVYKILANPVRRQILTWLREPSLHFPNALLPLEQGVSVSDICEQTGLSQATISVHLGVMAREGLVIRKRIGQWVLFRRNESLIRAFIDQVSVQL
jgi:DNA-binding transcriptional ArsR family regulator